MLLGWLARKHSRENFAAAECAIEGALDGLIEDPARRTADLGGSLGTRAFAAALCEELSEFQE
jgi:isocitrate/isopropylmalate dehydrogenase